jgi:hypothetical protein
MHWLMLDGLGMAGVRPVVSSTRRMSPTHDFDTLLGSLAE